MEGGRGQKSINRTHKIQMFQHEPYIYVNMAILNFFFFGCVDTFWL